MSKQVDERVVSLQFDNKRFEQNVSQSMSTLDKLKQKLHLKGASKGLEDVNAAAKKVDMSGMAKGADTVSARFSAMQVVGVTALANITNSAVNAGKQLLSSIFLAPPKEGFQEYEMTLNAIQTTMSATGKTAEEVQKELDKLDEYADKTVYSTSDMLNNLPKFTNAGVELEKATTAMIGIANATALAGGDASKASIAFYNLGQAIGTGYLTRMDYNSINNAGIATMQWKQQMVDAAIAAGTLKKAGEDAYVAGGKTFTLQQLFIDGLQQQWATTDVMMKVFQDYGDETTEIGKKSFSAAQDIKTFSMMMDSLKATAGTGWKNTWQIIFGDLEDAKKMWTRLANFISGIIQKIDDFRNGILESALGRTFTELGEKIKAILDRINGAANKVKESLDAVKKPLLDYDKLVDEIIAGKWKNAPTRWQDLTAAGYDWAHAQNLVNERLGCSVRHATNYNAAQDGLNKSQEKSLETQKQLTKADAKLLEELLALSDAELKLKGLTDDEIKSLREFEKLAKKLGLPISELIANIDEIDGRWLVIEGFANIGKSITGVFKAMGKAWNEIFNSDGKSTVQKIADALFNAIAAFHRFSRALLLNEENSDKLKRTFKGLFAIIKLIWTIVGGPIRIAFKILSKILGAFHINLLDITAVVGDAIVKFCDWLDSLLDFEAVAKWLAPYINKATEAIKKWVKETKPLEKITGFFKSLGSAVKKAFASFKDSKAFEVGKNIISGLWTGIKSGAGKLWDVFGDILTTLIEKVKKLLGIHSPSVVFAAIGGFIIAGLFSGLTNGFPGVFDSISGFFNKIISFITSIDWGAILAGASSIGLLVVGGKFAGALKSVASAFEGVTEALVNVSIGIRRIGVGLGKYFKAKAWEARGKALLNFALAIGVLALSVYVLAQLDQGKLWSAVGAIAVLGVVLAGLMFMVASLNGLNTLSIGKKGISATLITTTILPIALAMLVLAIAVKQLGQMGTGELIQGGVAITILAGVLLGLMAATQLVGGNYTKVGSNLLKMALSIWLLVKVVDLIGGMEPEALVKGIFFMTVFGGFIVGLIAATKLAGPNLNRLGGTILKLSISILLLVFVARIIGSLDEEALAKGAIGIIAFGAIIAGLIAMTRLAGGGTIAKVGSTILAISFAMLLMAGTVGILGMMDVGTLAKGATVIAIFGGIIAGLIFTIGKYGRQVKGVAFTILSLAFSIALLAGIAALLGLVSIEHLAKGIIAVGLLSGMMAVMIKALKGAQNVKGALMMIAVAIAVMAGAVIGLSFIEPDRVATAAGAMTAMMGVFAVMIKSAKSLKKVGSIITPLALMVGVVVILAGVLVALSVLEVDVALQTTVGLALLMLSMSASLVILSAVGKFAKDALLGVVALLAMAVPLLAFVGVLALMQNVQNATQNALLLAALATVLTVLLIPLTLVGALCTTALLGVVALTAMAIPLLAIVGVLALMQGIENATENANLIMKLLTVMTAVLVVLAIVGPLALVGVAAVTALSGLIVVIGVLATAIGGLMELCPSLESFLDTGLNILIKLAGGIGEMIGAFVGGIAVQIAETLPTIGQCLSDFMNNATGFIEGTKQVDESVGKGVSVLVAAILGLTVADFLNGVLSFLSGGISFADLGTQLSLFMMNAMPFIMGASMIKPESMTGIKTLTDAILMLTGANILERIGSLLGGEGSLASFGSQLGGLGSSLRTFVDNLGTFDESTVTTVDCAGKAIKALAEAADTIPNEGGIWAAIAGDNSLATFSGRLPQLGLDLGAFITNLGTFGEDKVAVVDCAGRAITALAKAAAEIPNEGGLWGLIAGDNSLADFSDRLPQLGLDLGAFITNLGEFGEDKVDVVDCAGRAITALAKAAAELPNEGGLWGLLAGDNGLAEFSDQLPGLGTDLSKFIKNLGTFGQEQIDSVDSASKVIGKIVKLGDIDIEDVADGLDDLGSELIDFADDLVDFTDSMSEVTSKSLDSAIKKIKNLIDLAKTIASVSIDSLETFSESFVDLAEDAVEGFVDAFEDSTPKADVKKAAKALAKAAYDAMKAKDIIGEFKTAGKDCAKGFRDGLKNKDVKAEVIKAGTSLGKAALKAAKEALDENSPSKEMYKVGDFAGIGFINALRDSVAGAYKAGKELGNSALDSTRSAMSRIVDAINGDMDMQPSIRPVLDLSDVRTGVNSIGSMLSGTRTLAVNAAGIGAISANMSEIQNGRNNSDVVSAIKGLRKDINNLPRESVSINGITYDDGSNIASAVEAIVQQARIERRR